MKLSVLGSNLDNPPLVLIHKRTVFILQDAVYDVADQSILLVIGGGRPRSGVKFAEPILCTGPNHAGSTHIYRRHHIVGKCVKIG